MNSLVHFSAKSPKCQNVLNRGGNTVPEKPVSLHDKCSNNCFSDNLTKNIFYVKRSFLIIKKKTILKTFLSPALTPQNIAVKQKISFQF